MSIEETHEEQDLHQSDASLEADELYSRAPFQTERRARARRTVERDRCVACAEHCVAPDAPARVDLSLDGEPINVGGESQLFRIK